MALNFANNNSLSAITTQPSGLSGGAMTLLATETASSSDTISFTSGIDDTYDEYVFKFINIHPGTDNKIFQFQVDTGTNTNYNQTLTTTSFRAYNDEAGSETSLGYVSSQDQAQGTSFEFLAGGIGADNDQCGVGTLHLFNPASSVFVKHFFAVTHISEAGDYTENRFQAGYINTTTAITRVQFKMSSGNIDSGVIKLYGIS
jgi:hypothetical protein